MRLRQTVIDTLTANDVRVAIGGHGIQHYWRAEAASSRYRSVGRPGGARCGFLGPAPSASGRGVRRTHFEVGARSSSSAMPYLWIAKSSANLAPFHPLAGVVKKIQLSVTPSLACDSPLRSSTTGAIRLMFVQYPLLRLFLNINRYI